MKFAWTMLLMLFLSVNVFAHDQELELKDHAEDKQQLGYSDTGELSLDSLSRGVDELAETVGKLVEQTNKNTKNVKSLASNQESLLKRVEALEGKKTLGVQRNDGRPNPCGLGSVQTNNDPIIAIDGVPVGNGFFNYPQLGSGYLAYGNQQQPQPGGSWGSTPARTTYSTRSNFVYRSPPTVAAPQITIPNLGSVGSGNVSYKAKARVSSGTGWFPGKLLGKSLGRVVAPVATRRRQVNTSRCPGGVCPY